MMRSLLFQRRITLTFLTFLAVLIISSCEKENTDIKLPFDLTRAVAISNEGSFGSSNASLSLYYPDGDSVVNNVFYKVNNRHLGDVFQSVGFSDYNAYLIINASNKIEVVNQKSCIEVATISDISNPRYFLAITNHKAYVTLWGNGGKIAVIDLITNAITTQIDVGTGPEKLIYINGKVFIANSGGWGTDNRISVINPQTDEVTATITVGDNPKDFVIDKNNMLWVLCSGNILYDNNYNISSQTSSQLIMINPETNEIEKTISLGEAFHPSHLEINPTKDVLYYGADFGVSGIFALAISSSNKATEPIIDEYFYGFNVDPVNGTIYGLQAPSFTTSGNLKRYSPQGNVLGNYTLGIGSNGAYFTK